MKRALAFVGFSYLLIQMLAAFLPPEALLPLAVIFLACFLAVRAFCKRLAVPVQLPLFLAVCAAAFLLRFGYYAAVVFPARALCGKTHTVSAVVIEAQPSYNSTANVTLSVRQLDGKRVFWPLRVYVPQMSAPAAGDYLTGLTLRFESNDGQADSLYSYTKGVYLTATPLSAPQSTHLDKGLRSIFARVQNTLSENIRQSLPQGGAVVAAMSVGDKRWLSAQTKEAYRAAGISHMLVVSGLHLSAAASAAYFLGKRLFYKRRAAAALGLFVTVLFMFLTGFTPSVMRAGVTLLLVNIGMLLSLVPDTVTSLGFAALVLCIANPFAAMDAGLLLSFSATLGILACLFYTERLQKRPLWQKHPRLFKVFVAVLVSISATLATLPVLLYFGMGVSLLSVFCNLLCGALLPIIAFCGFALGLIPPSLTLLTLPFRAVAGVCTAFLQWIAAGANAIPWGFVYIGREALVLVFCLYALAYFGFRMKVKRMPLYLSAFAVLGIVAQMFLARGLVSVSLVGNTQAPPVLIVQDGQALVILQSAASGHSVQNALKQANLSHADMVIDLRKDAKAAAPNNFPYDTYYFPEREIVNLADISFTDDIMVSIRRQENAIVAYVDIGGFTICLNSGKANYSTYPAADWYLTGRNAPKALTTSQYLYAANAPPPWLAPMQSKQAQRFTRAVIRPGKSVKVLREELYAY